MSTAEATLLTRAEQLGDRLAAQRLNRNLTQRQLADDAGVALNTLRRLEAGGRHGDGNWHAAILGRPQQLGTFANPTERAGQILQLSVDLSDMPVEAKPLDLRLSIPALGQGAGHPRSFP
jgi:transcriptional regulator with XRE-family HTH domain